LGRTHKRISAFAALVENKLLLCRTNRGNGLSSQPYDESPDLSASVFGRVPPHMEESGRGRVRERAACGTCRDFEQHGTTHLAQNAAGVPNWPGRQLRKRRARRFHNFSSDARSADGRRQARRSDIWGGNYRNRLHEFAATAPLPLTREGVKPYCFIWLPFFVAIVRGLPLGK
jgi:hypothetical protein